MERRFTPTALLIWSGLLVWAADFLFVYVFAAVACAQSFADARVFGVSVVAFATVLATIAALVATAAVIAYAWRRTRACRSDARERFVLFLTMSLGAIALVAIVWSALPPLLLETGCA